MVTDNLLGWLTQTEVTGWLIQTLLIQLEFLPLHFSHKPWTLVMIIAGHLAFSIVRNLESQGRPKLQIEAESCPWVLWFDQVTLGGKVNQWDQRCCLRTSHSLIIFAAACVRQHEPDTAVAQPTKTTVLHLLSFLHHMLLSIVST